MEKNKSFGIWCGDDEIGFWLNEEAGLQFQTKYIDEALDAYINLVKSGAIGISVKEIPFEEIEIPASVKKYH